MTAPRMTPTNDAPVTVEPVAELIEMLQASTQEDGCCVFEHSAEEIGLHVMENTQAILAALASAPAGDGVVEAAFKEGIATGYQCGKADENTTDGWHAAWLASDASVATALARPRAAVGEREALIKRLEDAKWTDAGAKQDLCSIDPGDIDAVIAALQSPPAKVEG